MPNWLNKGAWIIGGNMPHSAVCDNEELDTILLALETQLAKLDYLGILVPACHIHSAILQLEDQLPPPRRSHKPE